MNVRTNTLRAFLVAVTVSLFLAACGDTGSTGGQVPTAGNDPTNPSGQDPISTSGTSTSGIPDLSGALVLSLFDKINYSGLADLAGNIFLPIVGDTKVKIQVTDTRSQSIEGKILVAFEDKKGFWGAELPSVKGTGLNTSNYFDIIFSDDELTVRTVGSRSGDDIAATFYYRARQGSETQCKTVQVQYCYNPIYGTQPYSSGLCGPVTLPDIVTPCRAYMTPGAAGVKGLGTFSAKFTSIAVLKEGN